MPESSLWQKSELKLRIFYSFTSFKAPAINSVDPLMFLYQSGLHVKMSLSRRLKRFKSYIVSIFSTNFKNPSWTISRKPTKAESSLSNENASIWINTSKYYEGMCLVSIVLSFLCLLTKGFPSIWHELGKTNARSWGNLNVHWSHYLNPAKHN